jgi:hypothetical protein
MPSFPGEGGEGATPAWKEPQVLLADNSDAAMCDAWLCGDITLAEFQAYIANNQGSSGLGGLLTRRNFVIVGVALVIIYLLWWR